MRSLKPYIRFWMVKQNQNEYYTLLSSIRTNGDWESWVRFFLKGVETSAVQAEESMVKLASLIASERF